MQIVINMPEEEYNKIKENDCGLFNGRIYQMIRNGTPLPKGHGDLIDRDALKISEERHTEMGEYNWNVEHTYYTRYYSVKEIKNAPTIIEADKAKTEDKK